MLAQAEIKETLSPNQALLPQFQQTLEEIKSLPETTEVQGKFRGISVADMPGDKERVAAARSNLVSRRTGETALSGTIEGNKPIRSLQEAIIEAAQGNEAGQQMLT